MAILTVSREFGSDGEVVAQAVAREMGYTVIDRKTILEDMKQAGREWEKFGEQFDQHSPNLWERYDWSFRGYAALSQSIILQYALKDNVVLIGRGGNFILQGIPHVFRVRLTMPRDTRIERIIKRDDVSRDTAKWLVEKADNEMSRNVHFIYGRAWDDPAEYDAVYNLSSNTTESIVAEIIKTLREKEKLATQQAYSALEMRAVAAKVKAGIAINPGFLIPTLEVEPKDNGIVLRGVTHNPKEHQKIEEEARRLAGSVPVTCALHYR